MLFVKEMHVLPATKIMAGIVVEIFAAPKI